VRDDEAPPAGPLALNQARPFAVRNTSLTVLAFIAVIVFVNWAQAVLIPITFAVMLSYALTPIVVWLKRKARLPKAVGAALTLALILGALGIGLSTLQPEALDVLDLVPRATQKFSIALRGPPRAPPSVVEKIQKAASEIEKVANSTASPASTTAVAPTKPAADASGFKIRDYILIGTMGLAVGVGQLVVVVVLAYFLLIAGDTFRRTLVQVSGGTLSKKKITINMLDEIDSQIQRFLLVQIGTSALLGVVAWLVFAWTGLDNAMTWACIGGVLHLVPYAGPAAFVALIALVAYVQFDTLQPVAVIIGSMLVSVAVIGLLLVPWLTQKVGSLKAVTVFVALLIWGWLWGIGGLLLGVPIVMAIKAVCERVDGLRPISAFLAYAPAKTATESSQVLRPARRR